MAISGFAEYLPEEQMLADKIEDAFRTECELLGAVHIVTPAVERVKTLQDKGSDNKEIYRLTRLTDPEKGLSDLALRFDHTVPLARYVTEHQQDISFPFMRYAIDPVWRGERAQKGRYRQFTQADLDVIGDGSLSLLNDAQMLAVIYRVFSKLKVGEFVISVNNRKALTGFLSGVGFADDQIGAALKIIDNLEKVGEDETSQALFELVDDAKAVRATLDYFNFSGSPEETINYLMGLNYSDEFTAGVKELNEVIAHIQSLGIPESFYKIDLCIARGLDYYTGTVYETRLIKYQNIGSICSGGRFDTLLEKLGAKRKLPGVGVSIGVTRLLSSLFENKIFGIEKGLNNTVLLTVLDPRYIEKYLSIAEMLRENGIPTFLYPEPHKLSKQLKYASKKAMKLAIIVGEDEFKNDSLLIRNLAEGEQVEINQSELISYLQKEEKRFT
ncbi:histidine--tRNA ligase [Pseudoalteromonas phenolica]|uniref:histidine--tRNA ligase n=1 Tax=Pseudoalteromonas phenolica TaxID=161398 RepID=UPI0038503484